MRSTLYSWVLAVGGHGMGRKNVTGKFELPCHPIGRLRESPVASFFSSKTCVSNKIICYTIAKFLITYLEVLR